MVSNQNHFTIFDIPVHTMVVDHSQIGTVSEKRRFANQCIPAGYSKTHDSLVPQTQTEPTHPTVVKGSRSPSKLGLQASNTWDPVSVWCSDLHLIPTPKSWCGKSRNPWQESNKSSCSHKQVCAQDNKSMTWLPSTTIDTGGTSATRASLDCLTESKSKVQFCSVSN